MENKELWEKCIDFHGHECPGLAIGFRAATEAIKRLKITFSDDEDIVCVTENDACGVDAIQSALGCSFGKGNLIYRATGKMAFSFFNRKTNEKIRLFFNMDKSDLMSREERMEKILSSLGEELFKESIPSFSLPQKARIFNNIVCEKCKESAPEHKIRISDGKMVCLDCFEDYSRGF